MSGFISNIAARLAASTGARKVGYGALTLACFLDRSIGKRGRASYGDVPRFAKALAEYRKGDPAQLPVDIASVGSSVGNGATLATPLVDAPGAWFYNKLMAAINPTGAVAFRYRNGCVDGSTAADFPAAWAAILAAGYVPKLLLVFYNMNDCAPAQFNNGQTLPGYRDSMATIAETCHNAGCDVVFTKSPHPSIVKNPGMYSMPAGIPQIYPTAVAAPVAPEAMLPPASASMLVGDFVGEGVSISIDYRMYTINQNTDHVAREYGCAVIDAQQFWFEGLQKFQVSSGSAAGAETAMFNNGETVHPNLVGHQNSYQPAIDEWVAGFARRAGQTNVEARLNGRTGINLRGAAAAAVFEIKARYNDVAIKLLSISAQIGAPDGNGVKAQKEVLYVDQASGDIVHGGGAWVQKTLFVNNATLVARIERVGAAYGVNFREVICGDINNAIAAPMTVTPFPDNSCGEIVIVGQNGGVGTSPQMNKYRWYTKAGVLTLAVDGANIGSAVFTVAVSGLSARVTSVANNTNLQSRWIALGA